MMRRRHQQPKLAPPSHPYAAVYYETYQTKKMGMLKEILDQRRKDQGLLPTPRIPPIEQSISSAVKYSKYDFYFLNLVIFSSRIFIYFHSLLYKNMQAAQIQRPALEKTTSHRGKRDSQHDQPPPHYHPHSTRSRRMVGKYVLSKTLGRGSMGKVKLAINIETNEKV